MSRAHSHYFKDVSRLSVVDVYRVCDLFKVDDPSGATQHAINKLLLPGQRGGKGLVKDLREARDSIQRRLDMLEEDAMALVPEVPAEQVAELEARLGQTLESAWAEADAAKLDKLTWAQLVGARHGPDGMPFDAKFDKPISPIAAVQALIKAAPGYDWALEMAQAVALEKAPESAWARHLTGLLSAMGSREPVGADVRFDQSGRQEAVEQNGNTGEHYLPEGLSWDMAPDGARALVKSEGDLNDCVLVWVPAVQGSVQGRLARRHEHRPVGNLQPCTFGHPNSMWTVVAIRP